MRLTLRTLIAYLDGTLDQENEAMLRAKIKQSDSIRILIERIRRVVSQPQLMAARPVGRGLGPNPNYASEYLDSTLDVEQVPEFEKLVIGSDMLLAEICEAHQVLSDLEALDTSASTRLKNRLYKTSDEIYKSSAEEPNVFPVLEDHASVKEEYVDAPSKPTPPKPTPPTIKPIINTKSSAKKIKSADSKKSKPDIKSTKSKWKTEPAGLEDSKPGLPGQEPNELPTVESDSDALPFAVPLGTLAENDRSTTSEAKRGKTTVTSDAEQVNRPLKLIPVVLVTICLTALVSLIVASYWFPKNDGAAETAENGAGKDGASTEGKVGDTAGKSQTKKDSDSNASDSNTAAASPENQSPDSEAGGGNNPPESQESSATNSADESAKKGLNEATDNARNEAILNPPADDKAIVNKVKANKVVTDGSGDEGAGEQNFQPLPPVGPASDDEPKEDEVINLFADKKEKIGEAENATNASDAKKTGGLPEGKTNPAESKVAEPRLAKKSAAELNNGAAVAVLKNDIEPVFRKTDLKEGKWIGLQKGGQLHLNDSVVALPSCYPEFDILKKVHLKMAGYGRFDLLPNEGKVLPLIVAHNGIATLKNLSDPNTAIDVLIGARKFQVVFSDAKSETVFLTYSPALASTEASKTDGSPSNRVIQFASLRGRTIIKFDEEVRTLAKGEFLSIDASKQSADVKVEKFKIKPTRLNDSVGNLTRSAKESFDLVIRQNPVATVGLDKLYSDTKSYVRKFAAESQLALDSPIAAIEFLNDPQNINFGRAIVFAIRDRMRTDSVFAQSFGETLEEKFDEVGEAMIAMLAVGSDSELESGFDKVLVDNLESPDLMVRTIAIEVLFAITRKNFIFRVNDSPGDRKKAIILWRKALEKGEIRFVNQAELDLFK